MSTQELKREIHKAIDEVPEPVLNEILEYLKHLRVATGTHESYPPLDYNRYQFNNEELKFNRDELHER